VGTSGYTSHKESWGEWRRKTGVRCVLKIHPPL
jgi:hypothetical protein